MVEEVVKATAGNGGMSITTFLVIIAALVSVITILGEVIKSLLHRKMNPLNGTLLKLDSSMGELNTTLAKIEMRTGDSDRALEGHTEKLIILSTTMAQLAVNETRQTEALLSLKPAMEKSLAGCSKRITEHCNARSTAILKAVEEGLDKGE